MRKYLLPIALGCFSITAQALLVRDFLHCIEENEITLGIFFLFWFIWIIPGTIAGNFFSKQSYLLPITSLLYIPAWLWGHFLVRNARYLSDIPAYEIFHIPTLVLYSCLAPAGISFLTGFLFTHCTLWWEHNFSTKDNKNIKPSTIVRSIYAFEALGAVGGGFISSLCIYLGFSHWIPFCLSAWFLIISSCSFAKYPVFRWILPAVLLPLLLLLAFSIETSENKYLWVNFTKSKDFGGKIITQKGEYLYGYDTDQFILLRNLKPALNFPNQEYGLRLLSTFLSQKNDAVSFLLIGESFLYTLPYLAKIPTIEKIVWIPFDFELSGKIISLLQEKSLTNDKRFIFPQEEPRRFLENTPERFDFILVYTGDPQTITSNQYLTVDFFELLKNQLAEKGVAGIRFSGGENFLGGEIATLGASIFFTFQKVFKVSALKPGEESWLFGSLTHPLSEHIPTLEQRLITVSQQIPEIKSGIVRDLYPPDRITFQKNRYDEIKKIIDEDYLINTEHKYSGFLFSNLFYLWKQGYFGLLDKVLIARRIVLFLFISLPMTFVLTRWVYKKKSLRKGRKGDIATSIETCFAIFIMGLIGMGISMLLLIRFQYTYGTLSTFIGFLSSMFMLGLAISPLLFNFLYKKDKKNLLLFSLVLLLTIFCVSYTLVITYVINIPFYIYPCLLFCWGFVLGFFLSAFLEASQNELPTSRLAVYLEAGDHLGAGIGAFIFPLFLLPLMGLLYSVEILLVYLLIALISVPLLNRIPLAHSPLWGRAMGYTLFPIVVLCFISTEIYYRSTIPLPEDTFTQIAKEMAGGADIHPQVIMLPDNRQVRFYTFTQKDENQNENTFYVFSTASLFKVMGYGGEIDVAVKVSKDGKIYDIKVIQSNETPDYLSRVEDYFFLYKGKNIFQPDSIAEIDTVSGATTTADAIKRAVQFAGKEFTKLIQDTGKTDIHIPSINQSSSGTTYSVYIFILFIIGALVLRFFHNDMVRTIWLIAVVVVLGFWLNIQYAIYSIVQLISIDKVPLTLSISSLLVIGIPLLVLINGNIYCGYLCPFGALAELISKFNYIGKRITPTQQGWYIARQFKYILAFIFFMIYVFLRQMKLISIDPLLTFFTLDITNITTLFGMGVLLAGVLYNRFWCRILCPTGVFLSLLQSTRIFSFFWQRTFPAHCDLGISKVEEIDCIQCNRCYKHEKK